MTTIAIVGGTGFLGKNLTKHLLKNTSYYIKVISSSGNHIVGIPPSDRVSYIKADVLDPRSLGNAIISSDIVYYLIHMMASRQGNFYELEERAANNMVKAVAMSSVKRVIYMGGLGDDTDQLSKHLASRHKTGDILRLSNATVIEFRASMIVGKGSVAYDIIANLVEKLPIMPLPRETITKTQPILLNDMLNYLLEAIHIEISSSIVIEVGGPKVYSYEELYKIYAKNCNLHRYVVRMTFVPAWIEAMFLDIFTPKHHSRIGKAMVESLKNDMVVKSEDHSKYFPSVHPSDIKDKFVSLIDI